MKNQAATTNSPTPIALGLHRGWQWAINVPVIITSALWATSNTRPFGAFLDSGRQFANSVLQPVYFTFNKTITFFVTIYHTLFKQPTSGVPKASKKMHCLPNRLHYIASSLNTDDISEPMRIGQLLVFLRLSDPKGKIDCLDWHLLFSSLLSPTTRGFLVAHRRRRP